MSDDVDPNPLDRTGSLPVANSLVNVESPEGETKVGLFTTPQALLTFPGSTAAVTTINQVIVRVFGEIGSQEIIIFVLSLGVGFVIYLSTKTSGVTSGAKWMERGVALVNSFMIAAAALGISTLPNPTTTGAAG